MNFTGNLLGVYSVIARLEPVGETKSTAELYLSGKGKIYSSITLWLVY